jgi:hypothetical protein
MNTLFSHIEWAKGQPHHLRRKIALTLATIGAGGVALVWLVVSLHTDSFALSPGSFEQGSFAVVEGGTFGNQGLAAAATALSEKEETRPRIEIVDAASSAPIKKSEQTFIPF